MNLLHAAGLLFAGLLAGAELAVCYGVRGPLRGLGPEPHLRLRQGLIRTLRVLVPSLFVPAVALTIGWAAGDHGAGFALVPLAIWAGLTFGGTVPINQAVLQWRPDDPPAGWQATIRRWERLDVARCWAAVAAFVVLLSR